MAAPARERGVDGKATSPLKQYYVEVLREDKRLVRFPAEHVGVMMGQWIRGGKQVGTDAVEHISTMWCV
jgi:hypothetical protein